MHRSTEKLFGLIGFPLTHSFSKKFFSEKFKRENLSHCRYELFPLANIAELTNLLAEQPNLVGLNVTIPYKQAVIPFLDSLDEEAQAIGAVNVIRIQAEKLSGHNSDAYGFEKSLLELLGQFFSEKPELRALILGTGGASKAISFVLKKLDIPYQYVSRTSSPDVLTYRELTSETIESHRLIINCTPVGTFPKVDECPQLPYDAIGKNHFLYDLVYNPAESLFLQKGKAQGARTRNGLAMLHLQAERAWEVWRG